MQTLILISISCFLGLCQGCSQPEGWKYIGDIGPRALMADLVVYGRIDDVTKLGSPSDMYRKVKLSTTISCVLKNKNDISVAGNIIIWDEDPTPKCVNNMVSVNIGVDTIMFINQYDGKFEFSNINVQGAIFNRTQEDVDEVMKYCDFRTPKLPQNVTQGGDFTCPDLSTYAEACLEASKGFSLHQVALWTVILTFICIIR